MGTSVAGLSGPTGRSLFASIVGESLGERKSSCRIASDIEEDLIRLRWPVGLIYGSEKQLSERFCVGRAVIREAARVLEVRGSARMRRGPNGGLMVLPRSREQSVDMAVDYVLLLGVSSAQVIEARSLLDSVRASLRDPLRSAGSGPTDELGRIDAVALGFFDALLQATDRLVSEGSGSAPRPGGTAVPLFHRSRAGQIAQRLMLECSPVEWVGGRRLGSAFDLCERYGVDRGVLRQAIRILESAGTAVASCGRGNGVMSQAPGPASVCRLIHCHFAAHGLSAGASMELFHRLSVQVVAKIAESATPADMRRIDSALWHLEQATGSERVRAMFEAEESQFSLSKNRLIDLFLHSTKAYPSWDIAQAAPTPLLDQAYLAETRKVAAALARNNPTMAAIAQDQKNRRLAYISGHPRLSRSDHRPMLI